jgi:tartrate dehydratase alpha subunit/fumarate hydratase class I-like protein
MTLQQTIKDILKDINCYLPDDKLEAWTNVILKAVEQNKDKLIADMMDDMYKTYKKQYPDEETIASL